MNESLPLMLVAKLVHLVDPIPRAVDHADSMFETDIQIFAADGLLPECAQDDASKFLLLLLNGLEEPKPFHFST